jgi:hypothetical protein
VLSETFSVAREYSSSDFRRRGDSISIEIFLNDENAGERFVLVYVDPAEVGKQDSRTVLTSNGTYISTGISGFMLVTGSDTARVISAVDSGSLMIKLVGARWDRPGK